ncbi:uncharacterized protein LOC144869301 isoform X1 [Branchiostoma floridae x Branchiostoma japonicum]
MEEGMNMYPTHAEYRFTIVYRGELAPGYPESYLESNNLFMSEHTGTHLDAPAHFVPGAWRLDEIPLGHLTGPGVVVDVRDKIGNNSDYAITQQDLQDWERQYGRIPDDSILLRASGPPNPSAQQRPHPGERCPPGQDAPYRFHRVRHAHKDRPGKRSSCSGLRDRGRQNQHSGAIDAKLGRHVVYSAHLAIGCYVK